ncbi:hypothetical protein D3C81_1383630 [compost metagenome]
MPAGPVPLLTSRSAARPWIQTAAQAASVGAMPCASSAPIMPASTSPVPAVASAALPVGLMAMLSTPAAAISVPEPFSTIVACHAAASARAALSRSRWISATVQPSSRAASSGCGVITCGTPLARRASASVWSPASRFSASASSTSGGGEPTLAQVSIHCPSSLPAAPPVPMPGPMTSADMVSTAMSATSCSISSGWTGSINGAGWARKPTCTRPAPRCSAARAPSSGAPAMPWLPPSTASEPKVPLFTACGRPGSASRNAPGRFTWAIAVCVGG